MARKRILLAAAAGAVLLLAAGLLWRQTQQRSPAEQLLDRLPAQQAVHAFLDVERTRQAGILGPLLSGVSGSDGVAFASGFVDAAAISVGDNAIIAALAGSFSEPALKAYLNRQGVSCPGSLQDAACALPSPDGAGFLSLRLFGPDVLGVVNGPSREGANRLLVLDETAAPKLGAPLGQALERRALFWAAIDPAALDRLMENPPENWTNWSIVARALRPAVRAFVTAEPASAGLAVRLTAICNEPSDAEELESVLGGLNRFAAALIERHGGPDGQRWLPALGTFQTHRQDAIVRAGWTITEAVWRS